METSELIAPFNLNDIIPEKTISKRLLKADNEIIASATENLNNIKTVHAIFDSCNESLKTAEPVINKLLINYNKSRFEFISRKGFLPQELEKNISSVSLSGTFNTQSDVLTKLSETPKTSLSDLKLLANKLNMVIIPWEYLNDDSYKNESWERRREIRTFDSDLSGKFSLFVLCPINHYSLIKHAKSKNPSLPVYSGNHGMVFTSIMFNIPMFRSILNDLQGVKDKISTISNSISSINENINLMQKQLDQIQQQVNFQRLALIQQQEEIKSLNAQLSSLAFTVTDPLLFAVKKDTDICNPNTDNELAFIGPVWGPDFNGVAIHELGLAIQKNQRLSFEGISNRLWR